MKKFLPVTSLLAAASLVVFMPSASGQTAALTINGVQCEQSESWSGMTACLSRATLDGSPFSFNFTPAGASGRLDQDTASDLILNVDWSVADNSPMAVSFYRGVGNGRDFLSWSPLITGNGNTASAYFTRNVLISDFNKDGFQDFYLADANEYKAPGDSYFAGAIQYVYLGSSSGAFTKVDVGIGQKTVHGAALGDLTNDGFSLALNTPWQNIQVSPNVLNLVSAGAGTASAIKINNTVPLFSPGALFPYLTTVDVNEDGSRDLVMLGRYFTNNNEVWLNNRAGSFTKSKVITNWATGSHQAENAEVADLNNDGRDDMIVMHIDRTTSPETLNSTLRVWLNDGNGSFVDRTQQWLGNRYQNYQGGYFDYKIADLDGDGYKDVIFTTQFSRSFPGRTVDAEIVVLKNAAGARFDTVNFGILKWKEALDSPHQFMPGSVVVVPVNNKPTVMFSMEGKVYSLRFESVTESPAATAPSRIVSYSTTNALGRASEFSIVMQKAGNAQYQSAARTSETVRVTGFLYPQAADVNAAVNIYVVAITPGGWFMRNVYGVFVPWSTKVAELVPAYENVTLSSSMSREIFSGTHAVSGQFRYHIGYRRNDSAELIYTYQAGLFTVTAN